MGEAKTYTGGCHCGAVRYEVTANVTSGTACNCSICSKTGGVLTFAPAASFKLLAGEENLSDYQFAKKRIHHLFCKTCGIRSFARGAAPDGREMIAINLRCLDGLEIDDVEQKKFDGRSL